MLSVTPFRQTGGLCGVAALKMVLEYYGTRTSERALARLAGATRSRGVSGEQLVRTARALGFRAVIQDESSFTEIRDFVLRKRVPVIVDWFSGNDGHYAPVVSIDRENITLMDPDLGHLRALRLETFRRLWFDFPGTSPRSRDDFILRRLLVIQPAPRQR